MNTTTTTAKTITNIDVAINPHRYSVELKHMIERVFGHPVEMTVRPIERDNCVVMYYGCAEPFMEYSITFRNDSNVYDLNQHEQWFKEFLRDYNE